MIEKPIGRDAEKATLVKKTAEICKVSERTVRRVIQGDYLNEKILSVYMELQEETDLAFKSVLIRHIENIVPLN